MNDRNDDGANPWASIVGPCYTSVSLARTLGWTEEEVTDAASSLDVLEVVTVDEVKLYPAFQVWKRRMVDGLTEVLRVLNTGTRSSWTWAQFLNTPLPDEDGVEQPTNVELLRAGHLDEVLCEAAHTAAAWSA